MNLAFSTLVILLILIPGIAFRLSYFNGEFSKKFTKSSAFDDFVWAIIPGIFIQLICAWVICKCEFLPVTISFKSLGFLIVGAKEDVNLASAFASVQDHLTAILIYNVIVISLAAFIGRQARHLVRDNQWDLKYRTLRYNNEWFYLIKGEVLKFPENQLKAKKIDFVGVDVMIRSGNEFIVYCGSIEAFYLSKEGSLESIVISSVKRRPISFEKEKSNTAEYYSIPGDFVLLKGSEIVNINFRYIDANEELEKQVKQSQDNSTIA